MKKYCIVGNGEHVKKKIIPAIINIGGKIEGIVSRNSKPNKVVKIFNSLDVALSSLGKDTIFIVCTPPDFHFSQSMMIKKKNFNLFIEKPITTNSNDLKKLIDQSQKNNLFFVEGFMYKYSQFYTDFLKFWSINKTLVSELSIHFTIPILPHNTFRSKINNYPTNLYDIGCYVTNLISDTYGATDLSISKIDKKNKNEYEIFFITSKIGITKIKIKFGIGKKYENFIKIKMVDRYEHKFYPFFFGREGDRTIQKSFNGEKIENVTFYTSDCFEKMFNQSDAYWLASQNERNTSMIENLNMLENLSKQYNDIF